MRFRWKKREPEPTEIIELSRDVALSEAATTLGRTAEIAVKRKDTDGLLQVVAGWIELSHRLDEPEPEKDVMEDKPRIGFHPPEDLTRIPEVPDPDVED